MELRGEVRRGYFVAGLSGLQFALPQAVEQLRAGSLSDELIVINATDPANLFGGELKDEPVRFTRVPSTSVILWHGQPVLVAEGSGERISTGTDISTEVVARGLRAYLARPQAPPHVTVSQWNGGPIARSKGRGLLEELGFYRVPNGLERWA